MPFIRIETNQTISKESEILMEISKLASEKLGKPESYMMTAINSSIPMTFAGSDEAAAFVECKSIGLPQDKVKVMSEALCSYLEEELAIPAERIYIVFTDVKGSMWGYNKGTF